MDDLFLLYLISCVVTGLIGGYVASQKNRSLVEGSILGALFSLLGVIIVALLPTKQEDINAQPDSKLQMLDIVVYILVFILFVMLLQVLNVLFN